jgi:hypothetical protein
MGGPRHPSTHSVGTRVRVPAALFRTELRTVVRNDAGPVPSTRYPGTSGGRLRCRYPRIRHPNSRRPAEAAATSRVSSGGSSCLPHQCLPSPSGSASRRFEHLVLACLLTAWASDQAAVFSTARAATYFGSLDSHRRPGSGRVWAQRSTWLPVYRKRRPVWDPRRRRRVVTVPSRAIAPWRLSRRRPADR